VSNAAARLWRARDGNTVLEFAMIMPVFFMLLFGVANVGQMLYGKVLLNGAIEAAARTSGTETGNTTVADQIVRNIVSPVLPGAAYTITRYNYDDFTDVGRMEKWTDGNANGTCDNGETYIDENNDGAWDNVRQSGQGGASDVVVYQVKVVYTPLFKIPLMPSQWRQFTLNSQAVKKNQPFAVQAGAGTNTGSCR
jgi:Flp pilus assembly protein TadG